MTTESVTHNAYIKRIGSSDYGHVQGACSCGWGGTWHSRRTVEGARLAVRDAADHKRSRSNTLPEAGQ